jgi:hypothetical protein
MPQIPGALPAVLLAAALLMKTVSSGKPVNINKILTLGRNPSKKILNIYMRTSVDIM